MAHVLNILRLTRWSNYLIQMTIHTQRVNLRSLLFKEAAFASLSVFNWASPGWCSTPWISDFAQFDWCECFWGEPTVYISLAGDKLPIIFLVSWSFELFDWHVLEPGSRTLRGFWSSGPFNHLLIMFLIIACNLQILRQRKWIILSLMLLVQHLKIFKLNLAILINIQILKNALHGVEADFDTEVLNALSKFIEGQWQLMIGVEIAKCC